MKTFELFISDPAVPNRGFEELRIPVWKSGSALETIDFYEWPDVVRDYDIKYQCGTCHVGELATANDSIGGTGLPSGNACGPSTATRSGAMAQYVGAVPVSYRRFSSFNDDSTRGSLYSSIVYNKPWTMYPDLRLSPVRGVIEPMADRARLPGHQRI